MSSKGSIDSPESSEVGKSPSPQEEFVRFVFIPRSWDSLTPAEKRALAHELDPMDF